MPIWTFGFAGGLKNNLRFAPQGILKIAIDNYCCSDLKILTDEAYDYVFPNGKPNKIKHAFSSKEEMHDFIDEKFEGFFEHVRQ